MRTRIIWTFAALATLATNGHAQINGLACNHDGSQLYFQSEYRIRGTEQPWTRKIFEWRPGGVRLFAAREATSSGHVSNFYDLRTPETTGAGDLVAYIAASTCSGTPVRGLGGDGGARASESLE
jgi:hypothetical protein